MLQDIKNLGKKYDIKKIKDGYARNFLIPRGLAKIATAQVLKESEAQKAVWLKEEQEVKNKLEVLAKNLTNQEFKFMMKTGEKGEVFGSVTKEDIKKTILDKIKELEIHPHTKRELTPSAQENYYSRYGVRVNLERPIKTLGEHQVEINLGGGVKTAIKINLVPLQP